MCPRPCLPTPPSSSCSTTALRGHPSTAVTRKMCSCLLGPRRQL
ncbi:hypothetical protein E2C01_086275 [Portunus trituberculatus]|uniref:Uncharacterized protein n=1 Tax=Portunus trituberculatus TaxID=210409 RepID=A0A5B7J0B9_PORTR|nr:hypothetical protein [Portunus trituberculatus]